MRHRKNLHEALTTLADAYRRAHSLGTAGAWTGDVMGRAEQEVRRLTRELREALAGLRKAAGVSTVIGRPRKLVDIFEVERLREAHVPVAAIARQLGVSRYTVYRALQAGVRDEPDGL